jgi:bacteriorhodopsin
VGNEEQTQQKNSGSIWLYAGVGIFGLAVIAAVLLLILKKKKSPAGEQK